MGSLRIVVMGPIGVDETVAFIPAMDSVPEIVY